MSLHIPADVSNIIFEYYAQIQDMKWVPLIDIKTGKLKWKVNSHSAKYDNITKLLKHKKDNLQCNILIEVCVVNNDIEINNYYDTTGTYICLKKEHYVNNYEMIIPIYKLYIEFINEYGIKHSVFCSTLRSLRRPNYDVYQDGNIHSILIDFCEYNKNCYSLAIEKY
jgi:hypothetical protein